MSVHHLKGAVGGFIRLWQLYRADHALFTAAAVIAGLIMAHHWPTLKDLWVVVPPLLITLGAFAHNDFVDREVDKLNRRERPLAKGHSFSPLTYWVPYALGALTSLLLPPPAREIALSFLFLSYLYNVRLKRLPLLGNAFIALSMAIPFLYAPYAVGVEPSPLNWYSAAFAFLMGLAREMVKDVEDIEGDKAAGMKTLAILIGEKATGRLAAFLLVILMVVAALPFRGSAALGVLLLAYVFIGWGAGVSAYDLNRDRARRVRHLLYVGSILGFTALLLLALGF